MSCKLNKKQMRSLYIEMLYYDNIYEFTQRNGNIYCKHIDRPEWVSWLNKNGRWVPYDKQIN